MNRKIILFLFIFSVIFSFNCSKKSKILPLNAVVTFITGDVQIKNNTGDYWQHAELGKALNQKTMIKTGRFSTVDLSIKKQQGIRIKENSILILDSLFQIKSGASFIKLNQKMGKVLVKLKKMEPNSKLDIFTPTATAGVRGTTFMVDVITNSKTPVTTIIVIEGRVEIKSMGLKAGSILLKAMEKTEITSEKNTIKASGISENEIREVRESEKINFRVIAAETLIQNNKSAEEGNKKAISATEISDAGKLSENKEKIYTSIVEIQKKYKHIESITLNNGSTIMGAIIKQEDKKLTIDTLWGEMVILKNDIANIEYLEK